MTTPTFVNFSRASLFLFVLFSLQAALVFSVDDDSAGRAPGESTRDTKTLLYPFSNCSLAFKGQNVSYDRCLDLNGGFQMYWNVPSNSNSSYVSIAFSSQMDGDWIGFGKSTTGRMIGSSAIVGYPGSDGLQVEQYYLGAKRKQYVVPGGNLTVRDMEGELVEKVLTVQFSVLLNSTEMNSSVIIWAKGPYDSTQFANLSLHRQSYAALVGFFAEPVARSTASQGCSFTYGGSTETYSSCQTLQGDFGLLWNYVTSGSKTKVSIAYNSSSTGYIGLGFGSQMRGSSAVIARTSSSGVEVKQYLLSSYEEESVLPGGSLTVSDLQGEVSSSSISTKFTIELPTSEISNVNLIWSRGTYDPSKGDVLNVHSRAYKGSVNFVEGKAVAGGLSSTDKLKNTHGVLNAVGWGLLIPIGIVIARYFRSNDPLWFYLHIVFQLTGFGLGLAGFITGIQIKNRTKLTKNPHYAFGIVILILSCLQMTALVLRPKKGETITRKIWNLLHHWTGRVALILAIVNVYIGFGLLDTEDKYLIGYSVALGVICATALVLEIASFFGFIDRIPSATQQNPPENLETELETKKRVAE